MEMLKQAGGECSFPPIAMKLRWMGHPSVDGELRKKQIPPLRCGMEMQKGCGMEMQKGCGMEMQKDGVLVSAACF